MSLALIDFGIIKDQVGAWVFSDGVYLKKLSPNDSFPFVECGQNSISISKDSTLFYNVKRINMADNGITLLVYDNINDELVDVATFDSDDLAGRSDDFNDINWLKSNY